MEDSLKLLNDLEKLDGLPLEKQGRKIENSLKISDEMKEKVEGITKPYIMIRGKRAEAIALAAYVYLSKNCSVRSNVNLHEEHNKASAAVSLFRKTKKEKNIYLELFHYKSNTDDTTRLFTCCKYVNKKTGRIDQDFTIGDYQHDLKQYDLVCNDFYYKGNRDTPDEVKGKSIEITYQNHFRFVDRKNSHPETLKTLKIIDEGAASMTLSDMLKFKNTVFLLDFMGGVDDADIDREALLEFSNELYELRKGTPGSLIVHVDSKEKWPKAKSILIKDFLEQFEVVPTRIGSGNIQGKTKDSPKRPSYKDNKEYMELVKNTLQEKFDDLLKKNKKTYKKDHYITTACISSVQKAMEKDKDKRFTRDKYNKNTRRNDLIYGKDSIKKSIHGHDIWKKMMVIKNKLNKK